MALAAPRNNPTFDAVALKELRTKGYTCRSCRHVGKRRCLIDQPSFPRVCRRFEHSPGDLHTRRRLVPVAGALVSTPPAGKHDG